MYNLEEKKSVFFLISGDSMYEDFPGGSAGKESACNAEDSGSIPDWGKS